MRQLNRSSRITKMLQPLTQQHKVSRDLFPEPAGPSLPSFQPHRKPLHFLKDSQLSPGIWNTVLLLAELFVSIGMDAQTLLPISAPNRRGFIVLNAERNWPEEVGNPSV